MACMPAYQAIAFHVVSVADDCIDVIACVSDAQTYQDTRSSMLNRLKEETALRILREIPADSPVRKSVIDESHLPENLRQFLVRMLDRRIELTMHESFESAGEWFDATSGVARDLFSELLDTARESARFPQDQWTDAVRRTTDLVVRYSVKPVDTLVLFAFGVDGESIHSTDLRRCVRFFRDHRPIRRAVIHFLDGHPTDPVARDDFEEGLRHFHDRLTSEYTADQWIEALDSLQELTTWSGLKHESVPVEGAVTLFRHLGLERLAARIDEEAGRRQAVFVKRETLEQLVRSELSIEAAWSATADEQSGKQASDHSEWAPGPGWTPPVLSQDSEDRSEDQNSSESDSSGEPSDADSAGADEDDADDDGEIPLWKQYQPDLPRSRASELENDDAPLWKTYSEDEETTGARIASEAPVVTDSGAVGGLENLETTLLGDRSDRRSRYVRILFKGDTEAYAETLAMISEVSSWEQVSRILSRRVFKRYDVDIYGEAAVEFTDALEQSFRD